MRVSSTPLVTFIIGLPALCAAFLIVPPADLQLTEAQLIAAVAPPEVLGPKPTTVTVGCTRCTWHKDTEDEVGVPYQAGLESELVFDIQLSPDGRKIKLNDAVVVPFTDAPLTAPQVPASASPTDYFTIDHAFWSPKLKYQQILSSFTTQHTPAIREYTTLLRIVSVDGVSNNEIDEIKVNFREDTATKKLEIISVSKKSVLPVNDWDQLMIPEYLKAHQSEEDLVNCQGLDCLPAKIRHMIAKVRGNKGGCGRGRHGHGHRGGPHRGGPHRHGRARHGGHHHYGHYFAKLFRGVLIPIFIGITAGLSVSVVGMLIGLGVERLYLAVVKRRGGKDKHDSQMQGPDEEKGLLKGMEVMEDQD